jgi:phage shock protein PspC (stress-responsive transcriptional regulator)
MQGTLVAMAEIAFGFAFGTTVFCCMAFLIMLFIAPRKDRGDDE